MEEREEEKAEEMDSDTEGPAIKAHRDDDTVVHGFKIGHRGDEGEQKDTEAQVARAGFGRTRVGHRGAMIRGHLSA